MAMGMHFHDIDMPKQLKRLRELTPEPFRAFLEFDKLAFADGALSVKTKELMAVAVAQVTQCPWCLDVHTQRAKRAGATEAELAETAYVAMAMAAGAAWAHSAIAFESWSKP
jgi:AhpD family alkylhydroperoxidase